ncbi:MAG: HD domain-containing protein [Candidatus Omnitrophica bacterium]|nr:HD domain-containing protein [Candidatus Omnitrophota bacterium]
MIEGPYRYTILWRMFFEKLLQFIDAFVMVIDLRGNIVFANKKYLKSLSASSEKVIGKKWIKSFVPHSKRRIVREMFSAMKKEKTLCRCNISMITSKGKEVCVNWMGVPLSKNRSSVYMMVGKEGCEESGSEGSFLPVTKLVEEYEIIVDRLFEASRVSEPGTASHAARVMIFAVKLAKKLKISKVRTERIKRAALLHDLGKLAIDREVLLKKGELDKGEYEQIKNHPHWGSEMVGLMYFLQDILPIIENHHENYDGTGYPRGLQGEEIPVGARILSVVDIYEALIADRPYRKGFSIDEAVAIIKGEKGRKLDPEIADTFLDMLDKGEMNEEDV